MTQEKRPPRRAKGSVDQDKKKKTRVKDLHFLAVADSEHSFKKMAMKWSLRNGSAVPPEDPR